MLLVFLDSTQETPPTGDSFHPLILTTILEFPMRPSSRFKLGHRRILRLFGEETHSTPRSLYAFSARKMQCISQILVQLAARRNAFEPELFHFGAVKKVQVILLDCGKPENWAFKCYSDCYI